MNPSNIVGLAEWKQQVSPHGAGPARCLACKHEWHAVAPVGTVALDCPECGSGKGMFKYAYAPKEGDTAFCCGTCDSEHFYFVLQGGEAQITCAGCADLIRVESIFGQP